jgi:hypothetical protein
MAARKLWWGGGEKEKKGEGEKAEQEEASNKIHPSKTGPQ